MPLPKKWFGPVLPNSSKYTTIVSHTLGKIKAPINLFGKTRLYTHIVNGSLRFASTWGRYLGRWGSRILGNASTVFLYYDILSTSATNWNNATTEQKLYMSNPWLGMSGLQPQASIVYKTI